MPKFHSWVSVDVNQNRTESDTRRDYGVVTGGERGLVFQASPCGRTGLVLPSRSETSPSCAEACDPLLVARPQGSKGRGVDVGSPK